MRMVDGVSTQKYPFKAKERRDRGWFKRRQYIWQGKLGSMEGVKGEQIGFDKENLGSQKEVASKYGILYSYAEIKRLKQKWMYVFWQ